MLAVEGELASGLHPPGIRGIRFRSISNFIPDAHYIATLRSRVMLFILCPVPGLAAYADH